MNPAQSAFGNLGTLPGAQAAAAFGTAMADTMKSLSGISFPPEKLAAIQSEYLQAATALWNEAMMASMARNTFAAALRMATGGGADEAAPAGGPAIKDRRFSGAAWSSNPTTAYIAQMYLLNARTMMKLAESVHGDPKARARIGFAVQQWIDAVSPSNFLATNPDAIQRAIDTKGESLAKGMQLLAEDVRKGKVSHTDDSAFEVGKNVATTEGAVVYRGELFELIEYKPTTRTVHERPMLFVPPCINKFYILDLQPNNSVIKHTVDQGHHLFVVSWRNPDDSLKDKTWDDYIENGPIEAIHAVQDITGHDKVNTLGFCVGGTILTTGLAVLAARGEHPAHSMTLLTTLLDFEETGILDVFVDEAAVQLREATIGEAAPSGPGMLRGAELATTFNFLRPNDLVWNYVVGSYLKGEAPPPFDLLYWNGDSTNLPGPMYCWYLRHMYLQNELRQPGKLTVCGESVDVGAIACPVYIYGSREDHIVPWDGAYRSVRLFKGKRRFVLGASGHIAGVINPPAARKRSYWTNDKLPATAGQWFDGATEQPGSWWTDWFEWLAVQGGKQVAAPKGYGNRRHKAIEPAPGAYVKLKA